MSGNRSSFITFFIIACALFFFSASVAARQQATQVPTADTSTAFLTDSSKLSSLQSKLAQTPDSSVVQSRPDFFSYLRNFANSNEGLITLVLGLIAGAWAIFLFRKSRRAEPTPQKEPDTRDAKQPYLDHLIATHQHLPVAGFETNLRVPIPLEKVFVTLHTRMADLERFRPDSEKGFLNLRDAQPDRSITVQEALKFSLGRKYDGVVILGHPGSGKTTLTKYFALCFATEKAEKNLQLSRKLLPILLFLRDVDPQKSLIENILAPLRKYQISVDENFFLPYLKNGEAIILLDGLDEVATDEKRQAVSQWVHHQAHLAFPKCPLIVTSRYSGYRGEAVLQGIYLRLEIQDYEMPQVRQFVENWLTAVETHLHADNKQSRQEAKLAADDLCHRIETIPALRELAVNPLMLQIIALVHRDRKTLPERRVELYKECADVLLERWDKAKGLAVLLSAAEARQLLQPVALWMHSVENRREVSKKEILNFITPLLPGIKREVNPEALLTSWQERSGIFKGEGETYFFHHLSFQEYLTAEEVRNTREVEILVKNFDKAWWREPTLLAMGLTNPPIFADFMAALLREARRDGGGVDFMLRCIDETLIKTAAPFIQALRKLRRFEPRYNAVLALERIGTDEAKAAVREALQDKEPRVADLARSILAKWGEAPIEEKIETVKIITRGKPLTLPIRIINDTELFAEYILIPGAKEKFVFKSTGKTAPDYPLYFAKYPVTNKLYRRFIDYLDWNGSTGSPAKSKEEALRRFQPELFARSLLLEAEKIKGFTDYLGKDAKQWADKLRSSYDEDKRFNGDDQPVVGVSWFAATAYCHWLSEMQKANGSAPRQQLKEAERGKKKKENSGEEQNIFRLPIEEEWEWAASSGKRIYPWGDKESDDTLANFGQKVGHTTPVSAYPAGATPNGLMDMAGNVWEWMENLYGKGAYTPEARALRGGSWSYSAGGLRCAARSPDHPADQWNYYGFRVVCGQSFF